MHQPLTYVQRRAVWVSLKNKRINLSRTAAVLAVSVSAAYVKSEYLFRTSLHVHLCKISQLAFIFGLPNALRSLLSGNMKLIVRMKLIASAFTALWNLD